jgi:hypothetical protein
MAVTAAQIISDVRKEVLELSPEYWSDAELLRYINRAQIDYANKTRLLEADAELSLVAGQLDYPLPANWTSARAVFIKILNDDGTFMWKRLYPSNLEKMAQQNTNFLNNTTDNQGRPTRYWIWNRRIWMNKSPNADFATTLHLFFKSKPTPIVYATDTLSFDDELCEAITAYVLWKAWMKEQEFDRASDQQTNYDRYVAEGRKWLKRESGDQRYRLDIDSPQSLDGNFFPFGPLTD